LLDHIDTDAVIAQLNRLPRTHSALHVTMFKCFRETADGRSQEVTVEIYDSGPNVLEQTRRYYCVARGEDGKATSANSADSVTKVLATVHWGSWINLRRAVSINLHKHPTSDNTDRPESG
jgi:hypothetical protein